MNTTQNSIAAIIEIMSRDMIIKQKQILMKIRKIPVLTPRLELVLAQRLELVPTFRTVKLKII